SGAGPDTLAYVIYTSGSTGTPKGVLLEHRGLLNYLRWFDRAVLGEEGFALPLVSRVSFDAHVRQLFPPLLRGEAVWVLPEATVSDPAALLAEISGRERVSFGGVPSLWSAMLERVRSGEAPRPEGLKAVLLGGEALSPELVERTFALFPDVAVWNHYGPTEATVNTTVARVEPGRRVTLGRPIANVRVYLLDRRGNPVPLGAAGELHAAGAGVSRGYLGRPELTAEKYLPDPFSGEPGARLYRSGDRVRWRADGELEYLGRTDQQVKVRGFRIEPGEVEATLERHPGVREAAVVAQDGPGGARLAGYVVAEDPAPAAVELREWLRERLPEYMVPGGLVVLDAFPLTPNGKVDRRALARMEAPAGGGDVHVAPRGATEEALARVWAEVLGVERVGAHDDFFELGGHSLLATRVVSRVREALEVELPLRALFEAPTVAGLAPRVDALREGLALSPRAAPGVPRRTGDGPVPLSFAQQRLWFVDQLDPGTPAYNMPYALRVRGGLDAAVLERVLSEVVRRHESLRTVFRSGGGEPVQVVREAAPVPVRVVDLRALPEAEREARARRLVGEGARRSFDLASGPLLRAELFRLGDAEWALLFVVHHVVSDGWSMSLLVREVSALYGAFSRSEPSPLPELPVQYPDYALWQRERLAGEALEAQLAWWREQLRDAPPLLELPLDRPRTGMAGGPGASVAVELPADTARGLRALGRAAGATPFMTLLAGFQALLARWSGDDVVVGTPIAGRSRTELEPLIGFFVNTLLVRTVFRGAESFAGVVGCVRETMLGAHAHQDVPFERVVEELHPDRSLRYTPFLQAVFALADPERRELSLGGAAMEPLEYDGGSAQFELVLSLAEDGERIGGSLVYRADLFDAATMERMAAHLRVLLEAVAAEPERPLGALALLDAAESEQLLARWSAAESRVPSDRCVHELFAEQATRTPDALALLSGGERVTYAELDRGSDRLAHALAARGVGPDVRVGICVERSPELVVGLLGILKAGGAYVPLDPGYPAERLAYMLADSAVPVLLVQERLRERLPEFGGEIVVLDAQVPEETAPEVHVSPDNLAYVIYTSGSTGTPKGTEVPHRAIPGFFWDVEYARFDERTVLLQHSSTSWDALTLELWPALLRGGTCVLLPAQTSEPALLGEQIREHGVTATWISSAYFNSIVDATPEVLSGLRLAMIGGEAVSIPHV
ncbi:MAG TPA: amino acid adenylation domain-containing protein, partial [Longimicrobiaceae bacterium]